MLPEQIDYWTSLLLGRRQDLIRALRARLHQGTGEDRHIASPGEPGDQAASAEELAVRGISLLAHEQEALAAIDAALGRLRDGSFGLCVRCHGAIAAGRLQAQPSAAMCLACQEAQEHQRYFGAHLPA